MFTGIFALLYQTSCQSKKEAREETGKYTVTSPFKIDTSFTNEYVSQIRSVRNIEIRVQERGYLQNIYVDEGQFVKAGQLLFRIMPKVYEAELQKAEAEPSVGGGQTVCQRGCLGHDVYRHYSTH